MSKRSFQVEQKVQSNMLSYQPKPSQCQPAEQAILSDLKRAPAETPAQQRLSHPRWPRPAH